MSQPKHSLLSRHLNSLLQPYPSSVSWERATVMDGLDMVKQVETDDSMMILFTAFIKGTVNDATTFPPPVGLLYCLRWSSIIKDSILEKSTALSREYIED